MRWVHWGKKNLEELSFHSHVTVTNTWKINQNRYNQVSQGAKLGRSPWKIIICIEVQIIFVKILQMARVEYQTLKIFVNFSLKSNPFQMIACLVWWQPIARARSVTYIHPKIKNVCGFCFTVQKKTAEALHKFSTTKVLKSKKFNNFSQKRAWVI